MTAYIKVYERRPHDHWLIQYLANTQIFCICEIFCPNGHFLWKGTMLKCLVKNEIIDEFMESEVQIDVNLGPSNTSLEVGQEHISEAGHSNIQI